jgi:hypothetical protein
VQHDEDLTPDRIGEGLGDGVHKPMRNEVVTYFQAKQVRKFETPNRTGRQSRRPTVKLGNGAGGLRAGKRRTGAAVGWRRGAHTWVLTTNAHLVREGELLGGARASPDQQLAWALTG